MPGRPPKPTLIHKLEGTGRNHRLKKRADEVQGDPGTPEPPAWLTPYARAEWDRVLSDSKYRAALRQMHMPWIAAYCTLFGEFRESQETKSQFTNDRHRVMAMYMAKLGMNPCDAVKVHTLPEEKPADPWAQLG